MITLYDIKEELDRKNVRYGVSKSSKSIILDVSSDIIKDGIRVIITDEDCQGDIMIDIRFAKLHYGVTDSLRDKLNELNKDYSFFSFFQLDEDTLWLKATAIVRENSDCYEIQSLTLMGINIAEEVYPQIEKFIWND